MNNDTLQMLVDPKDGYPLQLIEKDNHTNVKKDYLLNPNTRRKYEVIRGIPILLNDESVIGSNLKYKKFYDKISFIYDLLNRIYYFFRHGINYHSEGKHRRYLLKAIEISPSDKVLEVAVGSGINLRFLPKAAEYYGIDISLGMLKVCRRNLRKWNRTAEFFQALAENLPFRDSVFDVVYHIGGFNFFHDRQKAIHEMIRVARPGAKIVIIDETVQSEEKAYEKVPIINKTYSNKEKSFSIPLDLIPQNMEEVKVKEIYNGVLYSLSFRVPF